jgi:hypothetical protein
MGDSNTTTLTTTTLASPVGQNVVPTTNSNWIYVVQTPKWSWIDADLPWWVYLVIAIGILLFFILLVLIILVICCARRSYFWCCCFHYDDVDDCGKEAIVPTAVEQGSAYGGCRSTISGRKKKQQILFQMPDDEPAASVISARTARSLRCFDDDRNVIGGERGPYSGRNIRGGGGGGGTCRRGGGTEVITEIVDGDYDGYVRDIGGRSTISRRYDQVSPLAVVTVGGSGGSNVGPSDVGGGYHSAALQVSNGGGGGTYASISPTITTIAPAKIYPSIN